MRPLGAALPRWRMALCILLVAAVLATVLVFTLGRCGGERKPYYTAQDFGIETIVSPLDQNENGVDDYTDILLGARTDAENRPRYDGAYVAGGYPPDDVGVCTDLVWRALKNAGYLLKDLVDADIRACPEAYPEIVTPDPNIDFRRVQNLKVYFERHAERLTLDTEDIAAWQPGDIVTYGTRHIGIVSDRRNERGEPYLIHNAGQPQREEDRLVSYGEISGHFRFDGARA